MTVGKPALGRLEHVNVRDYWANEASDFTPWLGQPDNIALLGETIGLELEVESLEKNVGPFRADILCRESGKEHYVLIENQLERTDHNHLGQLMTYAAGLDAATVVWVAPRFADEHRAALDWLNRITAQDFNFFGLEIELWRIGDSPLAPKFNVVCQPNDWSKTVKETAAAQVGAASETGALYLEFWTQFRDFMIARGSPVKVRKPNTDYWTDSALGRAGFQVSATVRARAANAGVHLVINDADAKSYFHALLAQKSTIEQALGSLTWRELPNRKSSDIGVNRAFEIADRKVWPQVNAWLGDSIEHFHSTFGPLVKSLALPKADASPGDASEPAPEGPFDDVQ